MYVHFYSAIAKYEQMIIGSSVLKICKIYNWMYVHFYSAIAKYEQMIICSYLAIAL